MTDKLFKMAAIQAAPIHFDVAASLEKACGLIAEAGRMGADIAAFGETWLPGYPIWCYGQHSPLFFEAHAAYLEASITIPGPETDVLCQAAAAAGMDVSIGVVEKEPATNGSVYCTLLFISREGQILGRHRKLLATHRERIPWANGDGAGLVAYQRSYARISGLNCFEHFMMLPGFALAEQGTQVHVAAWPGREPPAPPPAPMTLWPRQLLMSRAFAAQAGSYVILAGGINRKQDVPEKFRDLVLFEHSGDSCIIDPTGEVIAGPAEGETILIAEGSLDMVRAAKASIDIAGHYSRPDILKLSVDRSKREFTPHLCASEDGEVDEPVSYLALNDLAGV